jgi:hypothetical protein
MTWVAVGLTVLAAAGTMYNNQQVANRQDSTLAASLRQQGMLQQQQNAKTSQLIQKTSESNPATAKADLLGQFTQAMQQNKSRATNPLNQAGAVSSAYTKAANDAATGISAYGADQAGLLSSIDAPGLQRQQEAENLQQYATGLNQTKQQSASDQFLAQMKLNSIKPNPWIGGVTDAMRSYAMAKAGGTGGSTGTGTALPTTDGAGPASGAAAPGFGSLYNYAPVYGQ